jgi:hypothetical protein
MGRSVAKISSFEPPVELAKILENWPFVGDEKGEDYHLLSSAIMAAIAPQDVVGWVLAQDVVYWSWEIRRERIVKAAVIKHHQGQVVGGLLQSTVDSSGRLPSANYCIFEADADIRRWNTDPKARKEIDERLAAAGHTPPSILAMAYVRGANDIDAVDRRLAAYEQRRNSALREAGYRNKYLFEQLKKVDSEIIDAEFSEAAE